MGQKNAAMSAATSHIDQIAVPHSVAFSNELHVDANVWLRSGRSVQLVQSNRLVDHMPVSLTSRIQFHLAAMPEKHMSIEMHS